MRTAFIVPVSLAFVALMASNTLALTSGAALAKCQRKITTQSRAYAKFVGKKIHVCTDKVAACKLADEIDSTDPTACLTAAGTTCAGVDAAISANRLRRKTVIDKSCGALIPLADVTPFVGGLGFATVAAGCSAATTTALTDCLLDTMRCAAEGEVFRRDPRALDSLTAAGVQASFSCVGP